MIIPLYKERDNQECSNYRAKSFLIIGKLYDRFFKRKIKEISGKFVDRRRNQKRKRSIKPIIYYKTVCRETSRKNIFLYFTDLEKPFDGIMRMELWPTFERERNKNKADRMYKSL